MLTLAPLLSALCVACTDGDPMGPGRDPFAGVGARRLVAELECAATVAEARIECDVPGGLDPVMLTTANVRYDSITRIFGFDVTMTNLLASPVGTPDGTTATGSKAFFYEGPTTTSYYASGDTGTVLVHNPDGSQSFTAANQPYFLYPELLRTGEQTQAKRWELLVPRTVKTFAFRVRVFTATPGEPTVPETPPDLFPRWFSDPVMSVRCAGLYPGTCLRTVVKVTFHAGASSEERQVALDLVGGEVVGGEADLGTYFIRIPDTGSIDGVNSALARLRALPAVRRATPFSTVRAVPD